MSTSNTRHTQGKKYIYKKIYISTVRKMMSTSNTRHTQGKLEV